MKKIISLNSLKSYILNHKSKIIVLVTGCFDILHFTHKDFLKTAKQQGDLLIVGLESDKRVKKLKGDNRPINTLKTRSKNLAQLKWVDFIFPLPQNFAKEKDHLKLVQLIKPNILAISEHDKYLNQKKKLIYQIGSQLYIFPYNPKYSTTTLLTNQPLAD